tara:strand:- start:427 stop:696 length:270 start_codon:yes stop_codon:yes gene_type:complete
MEVRNLPNEATIQLRQYDAQVVEIKDNKIYFSYWKGNKNLEYIQDLSEHKDKEEILDMINVRDCFKLVEKDGELVGIIAQNGKTKAIRN